MSAASGYRSAWVAPVEPPRVSPFGEDFAPPRPLYVTQIPLILAFTGVLSWLTASATTMVVAALIGGSLGCYMMWDWLVRGPTRFSGIIAFSFLISYGLGSFNTWATTTRGGLTVGEYLGYDDAILARGMAAVLIASSVSIFLGEIYERPIFGRDYRFRPNKQIYTFIFIGTLAMLAAFASGRITFNGGSIGDNGDLAVYTSFLTWLFSPLAAFAVVSYLTGPRGDVRRKVCGAAALILLLLMVLMGRRVLIYTIVEIIFLARMAGYRVRGAVSKKLLLVSAIIAFVVLGTVAFMLLRIAGYGATGKGQRSISERVAVVSEWFEGGTALERALSSTQSNFQTRTFILGFFASVLEGSSTHTPALGENAVGLLQIAIPSALYPEKNRFYSEEQTADRLFGFGYVDEANSFLTNGAIDFGLIGAIVYPLAVAIFLRLSIGFASRIMDPLSSMVLLLGAILSSLATENAITDIADLVLHGTLFCTATLILVRLLRLEFRR